MTDERMGRLYGLPIEEFTAERNALAAELRADGNAEAARQAKALRKPTAAAWAVNQLVRAEPELVEALLGAGGELRQAHRQAAAGRGSEQLRAAMEAERHAVEALMARAPAVLGTPLRGALAEAMRNTLHAASSDDEARERVATGTVVHEMQPVGLGPMPAGAVGQRPRSPRQTPPAEPRAERRPATAALRREVEASQRALERADAAYTRARDAAEAAAERLKEARKRLREARAGLREAERRSGRD